MKTYEQLYAHLVGNQSDALDLLCEGRIVEAILLLQNGLETVENTILDSELDILLEESFCK